VVVDAPIKHPVHRHSSYEIILVEKGPYSCRLNNDPIELQSGYGLIIKPGDVHEVELIGGQRHYVLQFDLEDKSLAPSGSTGIFRRDITAAEQACPGSIEVVKPILDMIANPLIESGRFSSENQDCLMEYIFWVLLSHMPEERLAPTLLKVSNDQQFLDQLAAIEQENYTRSLSLGHLSELMGVSKSTLAKRCVQLLGESPGQYMVRRKINRAIVILKTTRKSIKEVSYDLGFQNPYHFSRVFKRVAGAPPSEVRDAS
jgi:AraC-like DNA-binding protein